MNDYIDWQILRANLAGFETSFDDYVDEEWLKIPLNIMKDARAAVQAMGGLLRITKKNTFCSVEKIASRAGLKLKTARNQLTVLRLKGWIRNKGRGLTKYGVPRRTCTLELTDRAKESLEPYAVLPF